MIDVLSTSEGIQLHRTFYMFMIFFVVLMVDDIIIKKADQMKLGDLYWHFKCKLNTYNQDETIKNIKVPLALIRNDK